jgi:hypothetical protein
LIPKEGQILIEFKAQFEGNSHGLTIGSTSLSISNLTEDVCEFDLTPHETSLGVKIKISNLKVAMRFENKPSPAPLAAALAAAPLPSLGSVTEFPKVGLGRVTTWQAKSLASSYPVYLETTTNLRNSRRYGDLLCLLFSSEQRQVPITSRDQSSQPDLRSHLDL